MMQATYMGVKNKTKKVQILQHDGQSITFEPGEVKILNSESARHALDRRIVTHVKGPDGRILDDVASEFIFENIPLEEALKHAKTVEDPAIVAARKRAEEKEQLEKELADKIMSRLKEQGWKPPKDGK